MNDTELPSLMIGSRHGRLALILRLQVREPRHRLHRRLVLAIQRLWIVENALLFLSRRHNRKQQQ
jgi:hypothetical protein